eukprot:CAMPEP_0194213944 /NCGR_PEP_ID=MMETSP0156-20130528/14896_1 /TAXON_ID=33649 /ORGANISM="Thalassionema nitzschioides, Strain L26-B" /LENGTH=309 /DNA_ID=CAMNT_0038942093 /DNA_START=144 /DNA_END=1069 /DNA_ORIENTATION=-
MKVKRCNNNKLLMSLWRIILFFSLIVVIVASSSSSSSREAAMSCDANATNNEEEEVKASSYKWIPQQQHRCNITKYSLERFQSKFRNGVLPPLYHEPIIIIQTPKHRRNEQFRQKTSRTGIAKSFPPNFTITLSSSNSFSEHRRTIPLTQYLDELEQTPEQFPNALSNETWYFFGETHSPAWRHFLYDSTNSNYQLPPCETCQPDLVALSFGIGNIGSGVQWHIHGPGFAETLWGRKHWIVYPPHAKPDFDPDQTSRHWMEYTYSELLQEEMPWECTLDPGDLIYFPNEWWHATINLDSYTSFLSTFTT